MPLSLCNILRPLLPRSLTVNWQLISHGPPFILCYYSVIYSVIYSNILQCTLIRCGILRYYSAPPKNHVISQNPPPPSQGEE